MRPEFFSIAVAEKIADLRRRSAWRFDEHSDELLVTSFGAPCHASQFRRTCVGIFGPGRNGGEVFLHAHQIVPAEALQQVVEALERGEKLPWYHDLDRLARRDEYRDEFQWCAENNCSPGSTGAAFLRWIGPKHSSRVPMSCITGRVRSIRFGPLYREAEGEQPFCPDPNSLSALWSCRSEDPAERASF
jgi:hypothetical protein